MSDPFLTLRVQKQYQNFFLDVELELDAQITALFGPSGAGKSTTLNSIAGLVSSDAGEIVLAGRTLFSSAGGVNLPPERRRVGYLFQEALLFPHLSVHDNLLYGYRRTPSDRRRIQPETLIELLELAPLLERRPATLSGGEAQRVALARALATSPDLLLLDEPLASLDARLRGRILRYLKRLHRELVIPMLYVSHSLSEVLAIAHSVVVLSQGRVVAQGAPYQLLGQPSLGPLVELSDLENLLEVEVVAHRPDSGLTETRLAARTLWVPYVDRPPGAVLSVSLRAADILVARTAPQGLSARNVLPATLRALDVLERRVLLTADVGAPLLVEVTPEARDSLALAPGQDVFLVIKSSSILVLD